MRSGACPGNPPFGGVFAVAPTYPNWQAWLRAHKPPTLVVWGRNDPSFIAAGAEAFKRDLPEAEVHLLDAGHFALDEKNDEIANLILQFMAKQRR
jgi:pimeloyl-ACP methyl ester carboxylesterase